MGLGHGQGPKQTYRPVYLDADRTHKAAIEAKTEQIEAAAILKIGYRKTCVRQECFNFLVEAYGFGTHCPWPLTFPVTGACQPEYASPDVRARPSQPAGWQE